jgi:hypothetical protein
MIKTGKVIYNLLSSNTGLTQTIGTNIFPLILSDNTPLPAVIYERSYSNEFNRDSFVSTSTIDITVLSENYSESINIAGEINETLNLYSGENSGIDVKIIRNISGNETFNEGVYIQKLTFEVISY